MPNLMWAGLPTVVAYHISEWVAFFLETVVDAMIDEEEAPLTGRQNLLKNLIQGS